MSNYQDYQAAAAAAAAAAQAQAQAQAAYAAAQAAAARNAAAAQAQGPSQPIAIVYPRLDPVHYNQHCPHTFYGADGIAYPARYPGWPR